MTSLVLNNWAQDARLCGVVVQVHVLNNRFEWSILGLLHFFDETFNEIFAATGIYSPINTIPVSLSQGK